MSKESTTPLIAITMGDPAGIGPGLVLRVLTEQHAAAPFVPVLIGDPDIFAAAAGIVKSELPIVPVRAAAEARQLRHNAVALFKPDGLEVPSHRWGALDPVFGRAAARCLEAAFDPAWDFDAVVSAPMNKESFHQAGFDYPDELSYMADLTKSPDTCTAGLAAGVWSVSVTEHIPFGSILPHLTTDSVFSRITVLDGILGRVSPEKRGIAVAALNPHAGEGGLLGGEEREIIAPAVQKAVESGIDAAGPVPADTVFVDALEGKFAGVVCLYHDQANIARKLLSKRGGATVFVGLPVPVTTTAHGTAFDIAGTGKANPDSLRTALHTAVALAGGTP